MGFSHEDLERLRSTLKEAPKAPTKSGDVTKQAAVKALAKEIQGLQKRGYSLEQVAEMLQGGGLLVTTPTLKSYLSRAKGAQGRRKEADAEHKVAGGGSAPPAGGVAPAVSASVDTAATSPVMRSDGGATASVSRPAVGEAAVVRAGIDPPVADGSTPDPPKLRSGKGAFLIKDKDSY